jgi:hypothetical protein
MFDPKDQAPHESRSSGHLDHEEMWNLMSVNFWMLNWQIVMGIDGTFWYMEHVNQDLVT